MPYDKNTRDKAQKYYAMGFSTGRIVNTLHVPERTVRFWKEKYHWYAVPSKDAVPEALVGGRNQKKGHPPGPKTTREGVTTTKEGKVTYMAAHSKVTGHAEAFFAVAHALDAVPPYLLGGAPTSRLFIGKPSH